jgi:DNA-binding CsgD family transcriptional regulator
MAAEGMSNREIAQALFVTQKTVESHLGRCYRKLGIRSRGQLASRLTGVLQSMPDSAAETSTADVA